MRVIRLEMIADVDVDGRQVLGARGEGQDDKNGQ